MTPTIGRIVVFTDEFGLEHPAIVMGWQENLHIAKDGTCQPRQELALTIFTLDGPKVRFAGEEGAGKYNWRWPDRVTK